MPSVVFCWFWYVCKSSIGEMLRLNSINWHYNSIASTDSLEYFVNTRVYICNDTQFSWHSAELLNFIVVLLSRRIALTRKQKWLLRSSEHVLSVQYSKSLVILIMTNDANDLCSWLYWSQSTLKHILLFCTMNDDCLTGWLFDDESYAIFWSV